MGFDHSIDPLLCHGATESRQVLLSIPPAFTGLLARSGLGPLSKIYRQATQEAHVGRPIGVNKGPIFQGFFGRWRDGYYSMVEILASSKFIERDSTAPSDGFCMVRLREEPYLEAYYENPKNLGVPNL